jgi:hypothetical protein
VVAVEEQQVQPLVQTEVILYLETLQPLAVAVVEQDCTHLRWQRTLAAQAAVAEL